LPVHECSYWSMEIANWLAEADGGTLLLAPPDDSALLRIDTVGAWAPDWYDLLAEARKRAPESAVIEPVSCGAFSGVKFEGHDAEGEYWREWLLTLGECFLLVNYSTAEEHRGRDRALIDRLLSTLADRRA
jgi:hypothetical protein